MPKENAVLRKRKIGIAVILSSSVLCTSCAMPFTVKYIDDPSEEIQGIRYKLKRPTYSVELQLDLNNSDIVDERDIYVAGVALGCEKTSEKEKKKCNDHEDIYSIKGTKDNICIQTLKARVLVYQSLNRDMVFEVRNNDGLSVLSTFFADTELSVSVDENGYLTNIKSKADDQILPFVQAVGKLVLSAAAAAVAPLDEQCLISQDYFDSPEEFGRFQDYVYRHVSLAAKRRALVYSLRSMEDELAAASPSELEILLDVIEKLNGQIKQVSDSLKVVSYRIPTTMYGLKVDGIVVEMGKSPWFEVELTSGRP